jgi:hypothetical protein
VRLSQSQLLNILSAIQPSFDRSGKMKSWLDNKAAKKASSDAQGRKEPLIVGNAETELTQRAVPTASASVPATGTVGNPIDTDTDTARRMYASPLVSQISVPTTGPPRGRQDRNLIASADTMMADPPTPKEPAKPGLYLPGTAARFLLGTAGREEIATKIPSDEGVAGAIRHVIALVSSAGILYLLLFVVMASGMVYGVLRQSGLFSGIDWDQDLNVAFIGNSYLFVNDIPRLMETISDGHIFQDSCIHAGGSLSALLVTGNGMYNRWATDEAILYSADDYNENYGGNRAIYDFGSCSVPQLLKGSDDNLAYGNSYGQFYDDGQNPCLQDPYYLTFLQDTAPSSLYSLKFDYVVLADQSKRMAVSSAREDTISALTNTYAPLLKKIKAIPVIVDTHAFWSDNSNMTGLTDVPTFTSLLYEGVQDYVDALKAELPSRQAPIVAPIGLAYLTIYEEDYELWQQLFLDDNIHSSVHGSYLFASVLYCTMFGHVPPDSLPLPEYLFSDARKLMGQPQYPSYDETVYLNNVARRVTLQGYIPNSLGRL